MTGISSSFIYSSHTWNLLNSMKLLMHHPKGLWCHQNILDFNILCFVFNQDRDLSLFTKYYNNYTNFDILNSQSNYHLPKDLGKQPTTNPPCSLIYHETATPRLYLDRVDFDSTSSRTQVSVFYLRGADIPNFINNNPKNNWNLHGTRWCSLMTRQPPIILIITIFIIHYDIFYKKTTPPNLINNNPKIQNEVPYEKTILSISPEINLRTIRISIVHDTDPYEKTAPPISPTIIQRAIKLQNEVPCEKTTLQTSPEINLRAIRISTVHDTDPYKKTAPTISPIIIQRAIKLQNEVPCEKTTLQTSPEINLRAVEVSIVREGEKMEKRRWTKWRKRHPRSCHLIGNRLKSDKGDTNYWEANLDFNGGSDLMILNDITKRTISRVARVLSQLYQQLAHQRYNTRRDNLLIERYFEDRNEKCLGLSMPAWRPKARHETRVRDQSKDNWAPQLKQAPFPPCASVPIDIQFAETANDFITSLSITGTITGKEYSGVHMFFNERTFRSLNNGSGGNPENRACSGATLMQRKLTIG
ncbi:hypothetical protein WN51_08582 [Melipona quadrifasciata]|uniref:Uncharacterized protein n=1 Tax=Melipona quadrifasciata TaxID=166423 RepID=A0A0M9A9Q7_9HYME|nr:hypothetical protein WN51_08582 [Melipona quadrifasciata]